MSNLKNVQNNSFACGTKLIRLLVNVAPPVEKRGTSRISP